MSFDADLLRRVLVLGLALAPPVAAVWTLRGQEFDQAAPFRSEKPLIEPAGYAFVIWRVIFVGVLAFAVYQALPGQAADPLLRQVGYPAAAALAFTTVWLLAASGGSLWGTVAAVTGMLAALGLVVGRLAALGPDVPGAEYFLVVFPLSLYAGWVTAAFFVNVAAAAKESGWLRGEGAERRWSVGLLLVATGIVGGVLWASGGNAGYAGGAAWALAAVVVANRRRARGDRWVTATAALGLLLVAAVQGSAALGIGA